MEEQLARAQGERFRNRLKPGPGGTHKNIMDTCLHQGPVKKVAVQEESDMI